MNVTMRAIDTSGTLTQPNQLILDDALPMMNTKKVRVIILIPQEDDINEAEWLHAAATNPAFDFLKDPREDIYTKIDPWMEFLDNIDQYAVDTGKPDFSINHDHYLYGAPKRS